MQDPDEKAAYEERKAARAEKRRATSQFDYESAGGMYVPTREQMNFCVLHMELFTIPKERDAADIVITGYVCNDKVHHDFIHIVNEKIRKYNINNN
jgi:hypothetical protein